jgi:hypothetical protein
MQIKKMKALIKRIIAKIFYIIGFQPIIEAPIDTRQLVKDDIVYINHACIIPPPPNTIPLEYIGKFTINGKIPVIYKYFDDRKDINYLLHENKLETENSVVHNTEKKYSDVFMALKNKELNYYGKEINAFYDALEKYNLNGKDVLIWGLADCNCDAIALYYNAAKVYVVDYNKPICDHNRIEVLSHDEAKSRNIKADAAFSYSSFEHDGLGRYGDPINPDGDIIAMQEARERLKEDGLLFLGVPLGRDCLYWNAHRVYGPIRLPMLLNGFQPIDVYNTYNNPAQGFYPFDMPLGGYIQCLLVCKKIADDYPEDSTLIKEIENNNERKSQDDTNAPFILRNILKAILDYKNIPR